MKLLLSLAMMTIASLAHAETATYQGLVDGKALALTVNTQLPVAITVNPATKVYDPEYQRELDVPASYSVIPGTVTVTFDGHTSYSPLYGTGSEYSFGLGFFYGAIFTQNSLGGLELEAISLLNLSNSKTALSTDSTQVEGIELPAQLSVHYFGTHGAGLVQFSKQ